VRPSPTIHLDHAKALVTVNTRYGMTRLALKTFTFGASYKYFSIYNAVLGTLPKRLLYPMMWNSYYFRHFDFYHSVMYVIGRQETSGGLCLDTSSVKNCTMAYQTLFRGLGIHNRNADVTAREVPIGGTRLPRIRAARRGCDGLRTSREHRLSLRAVRRALRRYQRTPVTVCV
jgi:hypothetical protein